MEQRGGNFEEAGTKAARGWEPEQEATPAHSFPSINLCLCELPQRLEGQMVLGHLHVYSCN